MQYEYISYEIVLRPDTPGAHSTMFVLESGVRAPLDMLGAERWELVSVAPVDVVRQPDRFVGVFKRSKS